MKKSIFAFLFIFMFYGTAFAEKEEIEISSDTFMRYMSVDKKVLDGSLRLILMKSLGEAIVTADFDANALKKVLHRQN